jgi:hypothetical protein
LLKKKYSKKYGQGKLWKFFQKDFEEESYEIVKTNIPVNQQFFITLDLFEMSFLFVGKFHQKAI